MNLNDSNHDKMDLPPSLQRNLSFNYNNGDSGISSGPTKVNQQSAAAAAARGCSDHLNLSAVAAAPPHHHPSHDGAGINTYYALVTTDNNKDIALSIQSRSPLPTDLQHVANQNGASATSTVELESVRVDLSELRGHPYFDYRHVEGFIISKHPCSPAHHLYPKFVDFRTWNRAVTSCSTVNNTKPPQSPLLSSIDDQTWKEFETAFSKNLKAGELNLLLFKVIAVFSTFALTTVLIDHIAVDPLVFIVIFVVVFLIIYECLRPAYFDKIDLVATRFQPCFAEKGIRISIAYYQVNKGKMTATSKYLVFTSQHGSC